MCLSNLKRLSTEYWEHWFSKRCVHSLCRNTTFSFFKKCGTSELFEVSVGVHQGSTLSLLLFYIVMNYVTKDLHKPAPWTLLYADNTNFILETMKDLILWCKALEREGLRVSKSKTVYMQRNLFIYCITIHWLV